MVAPVLDVHKKTILGTPGGLSAVSLLAFSIASSCPSLFGSSFSELVVVIPHHQLSPLYSSF